MSDSNAFGVCVQVSPTCPVEATVLSYRPNIGANAFFLAVFALCGIFQLIFGIRYKTWTFMLALILGCITEVIGYVGRIMLAINPYSLVGFEIEMICLIIAPVFIAAGIYLTLKHFVLAFGEEYSLLRPAKLYTWIFISADIFSLIMQGAGGALAATGKSPSLVQSGGDIALAGIIFQVASLAIFGILFAVYFLRLHKHSQELSPEVKQMARSARFRSYFIAIILAFFTVLIRCCYRIPELAGHWRNSVFRDEIDFIVLDGVMIVIAVIAMTAAHPGYCFGGLSKAKSNSVHEAAVKTVRSDASLEQGEKAED